jgi:hypothetical protein
MKVLRKEKAFHDAAPRCARQGTSAQIAVELSREDAFAPVRDAVRNSQRHTTGSEAARRDH